MKDEKTKLIEEIQTLVGEHECIETANTGISPPILAPKNTKLFEDAITVTKIYHDFIHENTSEKEVYLTELSISQLEEIVAFLAERKILFEKTMEKVRDENY